MDREYVAMISNELRRELSAGLEAALIWHYGITLTIAEVDRLWEWLFLKNGEPVSTTDVYGFGDWIDMIRPTSKKDLFERLSEADGPFRRYWRPFGS